MGVPDRGPLESRRSFRLAQPHRMLLALNATALALRATRDFGADQQIQVVERDMGKIPKVLRHATEIRRMMLILSSRLGATGVLLTSDRPCWTRCSRDHLEGLVNAIQPGSSEIG